MDLNICSLYNKKKTIFSFDSIEIKLVSYKISLDWPHCFKYILYFLELMVCVSREPANVLQKESIQIAR